MKWVLRSLKCIYIQLKKSLIPARNKHPSHVLLRIRVRRLLQLSQKKSSDKVEGSRLQVTDVSILVRGPVCSFQWGGGERVGLRKGHETRDKHGNTNTKIIHCRIIELRVTELYILTEMPRGVLRFPPIEWGEISYTLCYNRGKGQWLIHINGICLWQA